jgi:hypothetical protein
MTSAGRPPEGNTDGMSEPSKHTIYVLRCAERTAERQHHSHAVVIGVCADSDLAFCQHVLNAFGP